MNFPVMAPKVPLPGLWKVVQFWQEGHTLFKCFAKRDRENMCQHFFTMKLGNPLWRRQLRAKSFMSLSEHFLRARSLGVRVNSAG